MAAKPQADPFKELEELERLEALSADEQLRHIRTIERQLTTQRAANRELARKLRQAESDLVLTEDNLERSLYMQGNTTIRKYERAKSSHTKGTASAIVCVNDWHAEQTVDPATVNGVNEFNLTIADARIKRTWEQAVYLIDFARGISKVDEVVVWAGGDLINNIIHEELAQANWTGPGAASAYVRDHLITGIEYLLKHTKCERLRFISNYGNHGRSTKRKYITGAWKNSWEWLIYDTVAKYFENNPKVTSFVTKSDLMDQDIQGHRCRFHHGDHLKGGTGQGGIMTPFNKAIYAWNQQFGRAELTTIGHYHQFICTPNAVACGSLIGFDPFAQSIMAKAERPSQTLNVVDRAQGKIMTLRIFCDDKPYHPALL